MKRHLALAMLLASLALPANATLSDPALSRLEFIEALRPFIQDMERRNLLVPQKGGPLTILVELDENEAGPRPIQTLPDRYMLFSEIFEEARGGAFAASPPIRRREAGLILSRLLDRSAAPRPPASEALPLDFEDLGPETRARMSRALRAELMVGYPGGRFRPGQPLTRAQWEQIASKLSLWISSAPSPSGSALSPQPSEAGTPIAPPRAPVTPPPIQTFTTGPVPIPAPSVPEAPRYILIEQELKRR